MNKPCPRCDNTKWIDNIECSKCHMIYESPAYYAAIAEATAEKKPPKKQIISMQEFAKLLNGDLELEFGAAIQYINHAATIKGNSADKIAGELNIHASEEIGHAKTVSSIIDRLGLPPCSHAAKAETSSDHGVMLTQDLNGENIAIARYTERVKQADDLNLPDVKTQLQEILDKEKEHAADVQKMMKL